MYKTLTVFVIKMTKLKYQLVSIFLDLYQSSMSVTTSRIAMFCKWADLFLGLFTIMKFGWTENWYLMNESFSLFIFLLFTFRGCSLENIHPPVSCDTLYYSYLYEFKWNDFGGRSWGGGKRRWLSSSWSRSSNEQRMTHTIFITTSRDLMTKCIHGPFDHLSYKVVS